jgi:hypothetical protein
MNQIIFGCPRPALREFEEAQTVRPGPDKVRLPPSFGWISFCGQLTEVRESLSRGMDPLRGIVSTRSRVAECPRAFPGRPGLLPPATIGSPRRVAGSSPAAAVREDGHPDLAFLLLLFLLFDPRKFSQPLLLLFRDPVQHVFPGLGILHFFGPGLGGIKLK